MKTLPLLSDRQLLEQIYKRLVSLENIVGDKPEKITSDWMTPEEIQNEFGYTKRAIDELRRKGDLRKYKSRRDGKMFRYSRKECQQVLQLKIA